MSGKTAHPFARPFYMMAKPAGSACNLACSYCYYLEKKYLYSQANSYLMDDELLEKFISEYMESVTGPEVLFTWHGGETLLRKPFSSTESTEVNGVGRAVLKLLVVTED